MSHTPLHAPKVGWQLLFWQLVLPIVSGLMQAWSLPPIGQWYWMWVCLVPLGILIAMPRVTIEAYLGMYLGGLAFQLVHLDWVRTSYGGVGLSGPHATDWLLQGVIAALWWPPLLYVGRAFCKRVRLPMVVALPVLWVSFEYLRQVLFLYLVDETGNPWSHLGYALIAHARLVQIADIGGVYLAAGLVALVNGALVDILLSDRSARSVVRSAAYARKEEPTGTSAFPGGPSRDSKLDDAVVEEPTGKSGFPSLRSVVQSTAYAGVALVAAGFYGQFRMNEAGVKVGPVVAFMPKWTDKLAALDDISPKPNLLLWSEMDSDQTIWSVTEELRAARPDELPPTLRGLREEAIRRTDFVLTEILARQARESNVTLVAGCMRQELSIKGSRTFNSLAFANGPNGFVGAYDKNILVPWTEFTPRSILRKFVGGSQGYSHGQSRPSFTVPFEGGEACCGASICFETAFPAHYREYLKSDRKPDFFVHAGSEGQDPRLRLSKALFAMARFRAIECRRSIVRHVAGGYSGLIDSCGRMTLHPDAEEAGAPVLVGAVPLDPRLSLYASLGNWLPLLSLGVLAAPLAFHVGRGMTRTFQRQTDWRAMPAPQEEKLLT